MKNATAKKTSSKTAVVVAQAPAFDALNTYFAFRNELRDCLKKYSSKTIAELYTANAKKDLIPGVRFQELVYGMLATYLASQEAPLGGINELSYTCIEYTEECSIRYIGLAGLRDNVVTLEYTREVTFVNGSADSDTRISEVFKAFVDEIDEALRMIAVHRKATSNLYNYSLYLERMELMEEQKRSIAASKKASKKASAKAGA